MVYVDDMRAKYRRMIMCHMMADTTEELLEMAAKIGVAKKWIQHPGTFKEHFDVCLEMRAKAVALGAKEITWRQAGELTMLRLKEQRQVPLSELLAKLPQ